MGRCSAPGKKGYSSGASKRRTRECSRSVSECRKSAKERFGGRARLGEGIGRAEGW